MKLNGKLSSHPNFSEAFICVTQTPRTILKGLEICGQSSGPATEADW